MEMLSKKQKILVIGGGIIAIIIAIIYYISYAKDVYSYDDFAAEGEEIEEKEVDEIKEKTIIIHITGAVKNEGIVEVKENARINDVIEAAGGITDDADLKNVNLAYIVEDGQKIYIPFKGEENNENTDDGESMSQMDNSYQNADSKRININTASQEKLIELPGIRKFNSFKNYNI